MNPRLSGIAALGAVIVGASGCAVGSPPTSGTKSPTSSARPSEPTSAVQLTPRTVQEVRAALVDLGDLPTGFAIQPAGSSDDNKGSASSDDPRCAALVEHINAKVAPGSTASARISFSGGKDGPLVDESIDAMGSEQTVKHAQTFFRSAVAACRRLTMEIPGQGRSTMRVAGVAAPKFGEHAVAVRLTADGGPLDGLEVTEVIAGVDDVVVSVSFVAAIPDDVDGTTETAINKATKILGANSTPA